MCTHKICNYFSAIQLHVFVQVFKMHIQSRDSMKYETQQ